VLRPRGDQGRAAETKATSTNTNLGTTTSTPTGAAAPPGIFKQGLTPVSLASLLPEWPTEQPKQQPPAGAAHEHEKKKKKASGGGGNEGLTPVSEPSIQYCADEDDTQLLEFCKLLPERGDDSASATPANKELAGKDESKQRPSDSSVRFVLDVIEKECGFLRIGGHGVHSVKLTKAKQHPRVRGVLCVYIRGLPSRKRTKWLMPLAWCVAAVLQRSGCAAAVHGGYLYVAPPGHLGPALPVDFALWAGDDHSPHAAEEVS
jgi:hypothetical protein